MANEIVAIAHNAKAFDLHYILNRPILLKWEPELIMKGLKRISMKLELLVFLNSLSFLPCTLRNLPKPFGLDTSNSWYPHYFNTIVNLEYVGTITSISYYGVEEMSSADRKEFL